MYGKTLSILGVLIVAITIGLFFESRNHPGAITELSLVGNESQKADMPVETRERAQELALKDGDHVGSATAAANLPISTAYLDTPFFVFTPYADDPKEQGHGTMHKVGVHDIVAQEFPQLLPILPGLLDYNANRDTALVEIGATPQLAFRFWKIVVKKAYFGDDGILRIDVYGTTGARACGTFSDGSVQETWKVVDNQLVLDARKVRHPPIVSYQWGSWDGSIGFDTPIEIPE